jgi:hypothetical protein
VSHTVIKVCNTAHSMLFEVVEDLLTELLAI